ncbi:MAG: aminoacyl-tRNA hydrolase [Gammaproteobacteria bacterium]|nr:aminoacyl-tRNA hydrolase [Gammaproteobacteria bacterium]
MSSEAKAGIAALVGLGNFGPEYLATRHNAGFWFADAVAGQYRGRFRTEAKFHGEVCRVEVEGQPLWLLKPLTYMNRSGLAAVALASYYRIPPERILVVHDDLDFPPGTVRLKSGGGAGGHNGLLDLTRALGSEHYLRMRIGIGRAAGREQMVDYVLSTPSRTDRDQIEHAIEQGLGILPSLANGAWEHAVQQLHSAP